MLCLHALVFTVNSIHFSNRISKSSWINNKKVQLLSIFSNDSCEITCWIPVHFCWKHVLNLYWESQSAYMEQQIWNTKESKGSSQGDNMKHKHEYDLLFLSIFWWKYFLYSLQLFHKHFDKVKFSSILHIFILSRIKLIITMFQSSAMIWQLVSCNMKC